MSTALTIQNLACGYQGQTILQSLSLSVKKGEIVCLLGASGCGKTTLLKAIAGLLPISDGKMTLNSAVLDDGKQWLAPEDRNIGMIFQDYALFPHLDVGSNIAFGLQGLSAKEQSERVQVMLELVQLQGLGKRYPHQLSGGQQQRVAIARSLAHKPDLLLLDEPFSNIDTQVRHELIGQIRKIFKRQGVTAIFVTHSREEAFAFADKMAVMHNGVIEQFGSAADLYHKPATRFVAEFLGGGSFIDAIKLDGERYSTALGELEVHAEDNPSLANGQSCQLLLRPQHIVLEKNDHGPSAVRDIEFMGDHCRYVVDSQAEPLVATSPYPLRIGDRVTLRFDPLGVRVFVPR